MTSMWNHTRGAVLVAGAACLSLIVAGCSGSGSGSGSGSAASTQTKGVTITVALAIEPPPRAALDAFTKSTGITVKWTNVDWDSL